jgi:hypothetical protein
MAKQQTTRLNDQIIVRMDGETKKIFMNRVQAEGKTASEVIMSWIRDYLAKEPREVPDVNQMRLEIETLKHQVATIQGELVGKSVA